MLSRRVFHSFRLALQPVKHISSRRFARLSSHLLCNATVPVQFHSLSFDWQLTSDNNNLQQFMKFLHSSETVSESKRSREETRVERLEVGICFLVRIWFALCSADCGNWCCDTLITQLMRLLRTRSSFSINQTSQKRRQLFLGPPVA